jgi:hypothetical protein
LLAFGGHGGRGRIHSSHLQPVGHKNRIVQYQYEFYRLSGHPIKAALACQPAAIHENRLPSDVTACFTAQE